MNNPNQNQDEFPIHQMQPLIRGAIIDACNLTGAPLSLVAGVAFSTAALACQGHLRVRSPIKKVLPVSLFLFHVAKSGERKTTVESLFLNGLRDFQSFHENRVQESQVKYEEAMWVWNITKKLISRKLMMALKHNEDIEIIKNDLLVHALDRPKKCEHPKLFFSETTTIALFKTLSTRWRSSILQSSEAATILLGSAGRNLGALNILWEGGEVEVDRMNGASFIVRNANLSASLMIQPGAMRNFLSKGAGNARDSGFLARCLISFPASTQGSRFLISGEPLETLHLDKFSSIVRSLLRDYLSDEGVLCEKPTVLEFQPDAEDEWRKFYNHVESLLAPGGQLADIPDFASKISENVLRLAAIFHAIEAKPGHSIDRNTTLSAIYAGTWFLHEFKRLLGDPQQLSEDFASARVLEIWLHQQCSKNANCFGFPQTYIRSFGPNKLRNKRQLDAAFYQLIREEKIQITLEKGRRWVSLNMNYFRQNLQPQQYPAVPFSIHQ